MPFIIHPEGWRLYFKKTWRSNFFLKSDNAYYSAIQKTKVLYGVVNSLLILLSLKLKRYKNFLEFSNFKIFAANDTIFIIVKVSLFLKILFDELELSQHRARMIPKSFYQPRWYRRKNWKRSKKKKRSYKDKRLIIVEKRLKPLNFRKKRLSLRYYSKRSILLLKRRRKRLYLLFPYALQHKASFRLTKLLFLFFSVFPLFHYFKAYISKIILNYLQGPRYKVKVYFAGINSATINSELILNKASQFLIKDKFSPRKTLYKTLGEITKLYKVDSSVRGYKLVLAGRFTRRDRAIYLWRNFGGIPNNTRTADVEYSYKYVHLPYGKCIIQLWLCY